MSYLLCPTSYVLPPSRVGFPGGDAARRLGDLVGRHAGCRDVPQFEQSLAIVDERRLTRGDRKPEVSGGVIAADAGAVEVQLTELILCTDVVAGCSSLVPARGFRRVGRYGPSRLIEVTARALGRG